MAETKIAEVCICELLITMYVSQVILVTYDINIIFTNLRKSSRGYKERNAAEGLRRLANIRSTRKNSGQSSSSSRESSIIMYD